MEEVLNMNFQDLLKLNTKNELRGVRMARSTKCPSVISVF